MAQGYTYRHSWAPAGPEPANYTNTNPAGGDRRGGEEGGELNDCSSLISSFIRGKGLPRLATVSIPVLASKRGLSINPGTHPKPE